MGKKTYTITLRRSNGRYVKSAQRHSKYAAKKAKEQWEGRYDDTYYVEIEVSGG